MKTNWNIARRVFATLIALVLASTVVGHALAGPCAEPVLVVNKFIDTNDGVCSADDCSLREAVVVSNACAGYQVIQVPAGTYVLTRTGAGEDAADTGDLDITDTAAIVGIGNPVIDGNHKDRVFEIHPAAMQAKINDLTIQNGFAESGAGIHNLATLYMNNDTIRNNVASTTVPFSFADGGGILSERDNNLYMNAVTVTSNSADQGGGIMVEASGASYPSFSFYGGSVSGNTANIAGGGLWLGNAVKASLAKFEVNKNLLVGIHSDRGIGIYNASWLTLSQGQIIGNYGGIYGGGIYNEPAGEIVAKDVYLASNVTRMGAGLYNAGTASFYQSGFAYNEANRGQGGAIYNAEPTDAHAILLLENVTLSNNTGLLGGGAIRNEGGSFKITYSTIANNSNDGIHSSGGGDMQISNSILAGHSGGNCSGVLPSSNGYNIDDGGTCGFSTSGDLSFTSPLLGALADNGGWSQTQALLPGSPAIDTADPGYCISLDEREVARPQGKACDRGAYESIP